MISTMGLDIVKNRQIISNYYQYSNAMEYRIYRRYRHENKFAHDAELISIQYDNKSDTDIKACS